MQGKTHNLSFLYACRHIFQMSCDVFSTLQYCTIGLHVYRKLNSQENKFLIFYMLIALPVKLYEMITAFLSKVAYNSTVGVTNTNFHTQCLSFSHKYTTF